MQKQRHSAGQSLTESVLLLPLYFLFFFGVLQVAQLGVALLMTHYAASSIARKAANEQTYTSASVSINMVPYEPKAKALMVAGMQLDSPGLRSCIARDDPQTPTANLTVGVRAKLSAWPFFADMIHAVLQDTHDVKPLSCADMTGVQTFNFSAQAPYYFYVTGVAKIRLNYVP